jgi:galactokinase
MSDTDVALRLDASPELRLVPHAFQQIYGERPVGVWQAPGALTILGGPEDRFALAVPLRWGAIVAAGPRRDGQIEVRAMNRPDRHFVGGDESRSASNDWTAPIMDVVRALRDAGHEVGGLRILVHTDLPRQCGVPCAESALVVATVEALEAMVGETVQLPALADACDVAALLASSACPDGAALLVDRELSTAEQLPFDLGRAGLRLMLIDLGMRANPGRSVVADGAAVEASARLRRGDLAALGRLLNRSDDVADDIARVTDAAARAGALGAGVRSGGSHGSAECVVALVPVPALADVRLAVRRAWAGLRPPRFLTATPSRGQRPPPREPA